MATRQNSYQEITKTTTLLTALYALLCAMLLCACDNGTDAEPEEPHRQPRIVRLSVEVANATVSYDKPAATRAMSYEFEGETLFPQLRLKSGETQKGICAIRNDNPKIPVRCVPVEWIVRGNTLWCDNITTEVECPDGEELGNWQACFMLGQGTYDAKSQRMTFGVSRMAQPITRGEEQQWNLPYLSPWLPLKTHDGIHLHTPHVSFTPQGAFIRMRLTNDTGRELNLAELRMRASDASMQAAPSSVCVPFVPCSSILSASLFCVVTVRASLLSFALAGRNRY